MFHLKKKKLIGLLVLFLGVQGIQPKAFAREVPRPPNICPNQLDKAIEAIINRPEWERSRWGILIQSLTSRRTLYTLNADKYFLPASNTKLFTTAAALLKLGSEFRIRTSVYGKGNPPNLTSLRIFGQGDPSLTTSHLKDIARKLKRQGVRRIEQLIVDDSYFPEPGIHPTWEWEDVYAYFATSVNSLILDQNTVTLTLLPQKLGQAPKLEWSNAIAAKQWQVENRSITAAEGTPLGIKINGVLGKPILEITGKLAIDSDPDIWDLAIADPANYFLESFRSILAAEDIIVDRVKVIKNSEKTERERELITVESPSLAVLIKEINQESNNLFAEAILKRLGNKLTTETGLEALQQTLTELGVNPETYILADGSGLSRRNLVSPEAIVQTLRLMTQTPEAETYRKSLAIAGESGTLENRFQDTLLQENLRAKTGTLTGVSALSGYLDTLNYQPIVFSIIVNQSDESITNIRQTIDEIVLLLANLNFCLERSPTQFLDN